MSERGKVEPSEPVHPLVVKRHRLLSEWSYEFCAKYGVDYPDEATPAQEAEYDAGVKAIYSRIREEFAAEEEVAGRGD
ncbi:hypothetical protein ABZ502_08085 [Streptomyces abikoensis]|uniref:hypothetical protein n=1 Tax=Streptomyces abikoensis TaxID=97398 RepID=UPI0033FFB19E